MLIDVLNSGSSGNGYVIHAGDEMLLIEAGVKPQEFLKKINFRVGNVAGCIVSHEHS